MGEGGRNTLLVLGVGAGAFGGSYLAELLSRRPSEAAPDTEKLDYIIKLMEELIRQAAIVQDSLGLIVDRLGIISDKLVPGGEGALPPSILTPWVATEPELIYEEAIRNFGVFFTTKRVNFCNGKRLTLRAENTLDQPVVLQPFGNFTDSEIGATDINGPVPCLAAGNASIGLAFDDWQPYIGVRMTVALAPTVGYLRIWSVMQE